MTNDATLLCPVDGCLKSAHRKGYCYAHYMKVWRYGTPTPTFPPRWIDLRGKQFGTLTVTAERVGRFWVCECECGEVAQRTANHLINWDERNTCNTPGRHYRTEAPSYGGAHGRVKALRGVPSNHTCVDCGNQAAHWSYDHSDADELNYEYAPGKFCAYSADPTRYEARCVPCHKAFDLGRIAAMPVG